MGRFITSNEQLTALLPTIISEARGERKLIDKIQSYLDSAEDSFASIFVSFDEASAAMADEQLYKKAGKLVALYAMSDALPALDVVLHPSGLAVVNTDNLVPASKERSNALIESLHLRTRATEDDLLTYLINQDWWRLSTKMLKWDSSLVYLPSEVAALTGRKYNDLRDGVIFSTMNTLVFIQGIIARNYISTSIMRSLLQNMFRGTWTLEDREIIADIKECIRIAYHSGNGEVPDKECRYVVDKIRKSQTLGKLWEDSNVATVFNGSRFSNNKTSGGYFF